MKNVGPYFVAGCKIQNHSFGARPGKAMGPGGFMGKARLSYKSTVIETDHSIYEGKILHSGDRKIPQSGEDGLKFLVNSGSARPFLVAIHHFHLVIDLSDKRRL